MPAELAIGDLAERTGVSAGALRMWEQRYGFPVAERLPGGHRRYDEADVVAVRRVVELREAGLRLDLAVDRVRDEQAPGVPSVFATLRSLHPGVAVHRLKKATLTALSRAIEDEVVARAEPVAIWGAFQEERYYARSRSRWTEFARSALTSTVFADFPASDARARPRRVALPPDSPMLREWAVVVESARLPVVLTAFELPGQDGVPDRLRTFEALWSLDPRAVADAAAVCARVAGAAFGLPPEAPRALGAPSTEAATALLARMTAYVDRLVVA